MSTRVNRLLPICLQNAKCAYCLLIPLLLYATNAAPKPVAALLYIVNLPLLGLMSAELVASQYLCTDVLLLVLLLFLLVTMTTWTKLVPRLTYTICARYGLRRRRIFLLSCSGTFIGAMLLSDTLVSVPVLFLVDRVFSTLYNQNLDAASGTSCTPKPDSISVAEDQEIAIIQRRIRSQTSPFVVTTRENSTAPQAVLSGGPEKQATEENKGRENLNSGKFPEI
ncbi:hypothetical protein IscW_ISCW003628 [Ixodes scapularis]|uniref:Uncharacterized protein n=1 Tax=Ixodes scapularis TaxID=6945 RepID=B7PF66_IXOSC|nr:hypothetical protein IscW_ISCW003628 [Ixodes scapularis]|eukprot:XP_002433838.1 hypothetical protein IscW_ISCW003628 [Ixodes scapularis]